MKRTTSKRPVASPAASTAALLGALNGFRMGSPKERQIHTKFVQKSSQPTCFGHIGVAAVAERASERRKRPTKLRGGGEAMCDQKRDLLQWETGPRMACYRSINSPHA